MQEESVSLLVTKQTRPCRTSLISQCDVDIIPVKLSVEPLYVPSYAVHVALLQLLAQAGQGNLPLTVATQRTLDSSCCKNLMYFDSSTNFQLVVASEIKLSFDILSFGVSSLFLAP